jgi:hypothetical protein
MDIIVKEKFKRLGKTESYKLKELENYSNINLVRENAEANDINKIYPSTRKDKKYMVMNPYNNKWTHFGLMGYLDYSKNRNIFRRDAFRKRNKKWADAEPYTPAYLSYYLLW